MCAGRFRAPVERPSRFNALYNRTACAKVNPLARHRHKPSTFPTTAVGFYERATPRSAASLSRSPKIGYVCVTLPLRTPRFGYALRFNWRKATRLAFKLCKTPGQSNSRLRHTNRSSNKIQTCLIIGWRRHLLAYACEANFQDVAFAGVYACCALDAFGAFDGAATCDQLANGQAHGTGSVTSATGHTRFFAGNAHVKLRKAQDAAHTASTPTQKTASSPNGNEAVELR